MKYHLKVKHADVVRARRDTALQLSKLLLKAGSSPCTWCGNCTARPDLHVTRCSVVYQVALAASITGHTHGGSANGRGDGRPLRPAAVVDRIQRQRDTPGKTSQVTDHSQRAKNQRQGRRQSSSHGSSKSEEMEIIQQLSKIVLRHEDQLLRIQMDTLLIFQLRSNVDGSPPCRLCTRLPTNGKGGVSKIPRFWDKSLRQTELLRLIQELRSRLQLAQSNPQLVQDKGWLNERKAWVYQQRNPDKQQLKPQGKDTAPMDQLLKQVDEAAKLLKTPDILLKFQSTRPLTSQTAGPVITYLCELGHCSNLPHSWHFGEP